MALVTLVAVEGSSYRRPGARLLIAANGEYAGAISGGCLEAEVVRKAAWKVREGAVIDRYSTLFDDTAEIPYGLGCGGTVDLLLEPAGTPEFTAYMTALAASLAGATRKVSTQLPAPATRGSGRLPKAGLRRCVVDAHGGQLFRSVSGFPTSAEMPLYEEELQPPQRLILLGAGDDAQPMSRMAALLGWTVVVVDGRASWARAERFPEAEDVVVANELDALEATGLRAIGHADAVVLMSHSYEQDRAWLAALLPRAPRYLGLLGSRHRSALLVSEAAAMLQWSVDRACAGIFAPVGLDLGGDGAEAIALAVLAEVQACVEGKLGHSRRLTPALVQAQIAAGGASRYLQVQCAV